MDISINKDKFLKGTLTVSLAVILTKIIGVVYKVPLSYILGDEGMGYFNSAYAIYSFFYILCTSGVPKAITLAIIKHTNGNDSDGYAVVRSGCRLFMWIGLAITGLCVACAPALVSIIGSKRSLYTILFIAPSIIFVSVGGVLRGCMNSYNRLTDIAVSQLLEAFIKLVIGLALAFLGYRLKLPLEIISALCVLGITIGSAIGCMYLQMMSKRIFGGNILKQNTNDVSGNIKRDILKVALPISFGAAILNLGGVIDLGIIMRKLTGLGFSESEANALYGNYTTLAVPMFNLVISVISPIMLAFLPQLADASEKKDNNAFVRILKTMLLVNNLIAVPSFFAFYFYSFDLLDILFSVNSAAISAELLSVLSVGVLLLSLLTLVNTALEAKGGVTLTVVSLLVGSVIKAVGNYVLIGRLGVAGAPLSTVISYAVSLLISVTALRSYGVKIRLLLNCVPDIVFGYLIFSIPYLCLYCTGEPKGGMISAIFCTAISGLFYFLPFSLRLMGANLNFKMLKMHKKEK